MKHSRTYQTGLTLTEVLVSGTVGVIASIILLSAFAGNNRMLNEGTADGRMQMQSDAVIADVGRNIRQANAVLAPGETWAATMTLSQSSFNEIRINDDAGSLTKAYRIVSNILQESSDGANWSPFRVGFHAVTLATGSCFVLSTDRKTVYLNFIVQTSHNGAASTDIPLGGFMRCRN
jgi:hypothetical protein